MAHFARLKNNIVIDVVVISNNNTVDSNGKELEEIGIKFCQSIWGDEYDYLQTSYNEKIRKNYASAGFVYDKEKDAFIAPKPEGNYILNNDTCKWELIE